MVKRWKIELAEQTLPRIATALETIGEEMERTNDDPTGSRPSAATPSDETAAELSALRAAVRQRRAEAEERRSAAEDADEDDAGTPSQSAARYRGKEDAYATVDRLLKARLDGDGELREDDGDE